MTHKLKTMALALVAICAMSSFVASTASATLPDTDAFVADEVPVRLTGSQENGLTKFTLAGQGVECTTAIVNATVSEKTFTEVLTEVPTYSGCTFAGQAVTITMNGCKYRITGTTGTDGDARADLVCEGSNKVKMTLNAIACSVTIAAQEAEEGYTITTIGAGSTKELTGHITIKTKVTSDGDPSEGVTCASLTNGTGTQEGTFLITGENPTTGAHIGITDETLVTP
jgi:hypothetical protein